jgi:hypothetical protein
MWLSKWIVSSSGRIDLVRAMSGDASIRSRLPSSVGISTR